MPPREIVSISRSDLQRLKPSNNNAYIRNVKHISSYNWIDEDTPTIAVPGSPPLWNPPVGAQHVKKDSGLICIDENAMRLRESSLEPLFRALYTTDPSFDIRPIDVISDRHNVRKLLSFVRPGTEINAGTAFCIKLELVRDTLLMCRHEVAPTEFLAPHEFRGYGHEFEKMYTTSQISGGTGHHRIISYRFCGMKFLIRHETDGFVKSRSEEVDANEGRSDLMGSLCLSARTPEDTCLVTKSKATKLTVLEKGSLVPLESTLEIKTRAAWRPLEFDQVAAQIWVSQTPKLVRAHHNRGHFQSPRVEDVKADIDDWERASQESLRALGALIELITAVMKGCGGRALLQYDTATDSLVISEVEAGGLLPGDLYSKWGKGRKGSDSLG
ncbi:hypothetical protein EsDP_00001221 [Epichloe bromicola]|uniref:Geranylgeranyl pyrophosphate synthetase n=1 Tax=Epichloe bromicola TaxID=79588 RepID=A0ABQ0CH73_9HYPO